MQFVKIAILVLLGICLGVVSPAFHAAGQSRLLDQPKAAVSGSGITSPGDSDLGAIENAAIRINPVKRTTELAQRVFGGT